MTDGPDALRGRGVTGEKLDLDPYGVFWGSSNVGRESRWDSVPHGRRIPVRRLFSRLRTFIGEDGRRFANGGRRRHRGDNPPCFRGGSRAAGSALR